LKGKAGLRQYRIEVPELGLEFTASEQDTLLESALAAGITWPHRCCQGSCCMCMMQIVSGEVAYGRLQPLLTAAEQAEGYHFACLAYPRTDLSLRILPD
jgi:ferredoxin